MLRCLNYGVMTIKLEHQTTWDVCMIWSDELSFTLFPASDGVYVWRTPKEEYNPKRLVPAVKHRGGSVMVWAAVSWYSILFISSVPSMAKLLQESMWRGWVMRCIPWSWHYFWTMMQFYKTTMLPFTQLELSEEHEGKLQHCPWPAKSPGLNIIESLCSVFESKVMNRFPPLTSLKQLEWYKIPLMNVQNLRIAAVLKIKGGPTPS